MRGNTAWGGEADADTWRYTFISPDGLTKATHAPDAFGALIYKFRVYRKRGEKWYTSESTSASDYYTHGFATRYAEVSHIRMTNASIELTVTDEDYGLRHWAEHRGTASSTKIPERGLIRRGSLSCAGSVSDINNSHERSPAECDRACRGQSGRHRRGAADGRNQTAPL